MADSDPIPTWLLPTVDDCIRRCLAPFSPPPFSSTAMSTIDDDIPPSSVPPPLSLELFAYDAGLQHAPLPAALDPLSFDDADRFSGQPLVVMRSHIGSNDAANAAQCELDAIEFSLLLSSAGGIDQPLAVPAGTCLQQQEQQEVIDDDDDDDASSYYQPSEAGDSGDEQDDPEYSVDRRCAAATPATRLPAAAPSSSSTTSPAAPSWIIPSTLEACPDVRSNNKMAEDQRWSLEEMTMGVQELNRYMKLRKFTQADMKELRLARRRMKSRTYSHAHRVKKSKGQSRGRR